MNIKTIYEQLPHNIFSRTSKSYIININDINTIKSNAIQLLSKRIPLGKAYKEAFFKSHFPVKLLRKTTTIGYNHSKK